MMKTNLLSAVVTLGLALPGTAVLAQDTATEEELLTTPAETPEAGEPAAEAPASDAEGTETEVEVTPAEDATATEPTAERTPVEEETVETTEEAPVEAEAEATEEAPADEAEVTEEAPAEEAEAEVTEEAPAEEVEADVTEEAPAEEAEAELTEEPAAEEAEIEEPAGDVEASEELSTEEVIAEDDVDGQAHGEDPEVGVMEQEDHGEKDGEHASDDHGDEGHDDHGYPHIDNIDFSFDGPFGAYDVNQLQRGLQIYTEVCAACHGLEYVAMRTLADESGPNMPEDQVREYAKQFEVFDEDLDDFRAATPVDHFPASNLSNAPDLSLMAKKRAAFHGPYGLGINQFLKGIGGPEYITALLMGYTGEEKEQAGTVLYGNTVFPGGWIAMGPPLSDGLVEFADGHANDAQSLAEDVSAFLMWTAEPKLGARKTAGFAGVALLGLLSVLLYLTNKKLWAPHKNRRKEG